MPLEAQAKQTQREIENDFFGVNLRSDPTDIGRGGLARGINIDLYESPGVALSRRGFVDRNLGLNSPQRKIIRADGGIVHTGAVTFYDDGSAVLSNLVATNDIDMVEFIGQQAQESETFIANGVLSSVAQMFRYTVSSGTLGNWGITAPSAAPVVSAIAAGALTGSYMAKYTYIRKSGGNLVHESNPSPASAAQSLTSENLGVTVIASTDADVTNIRIYRTVASGTTFLFDQEVSNAAATITSSQIDGGLGAAVDEDNDLPDAATIVHALRDRLWTNDSARGSRIRYTKRFFPEAQPANNFVDLTPESITVTGISSINGVLIVFTKTSKYRIVEQVSGIEAIGEDIPFIGAATNDFVVFELPSSRGCLAPNAIVSVAPGIIYPTKDGLFLTTGTNEPEQLLSQAIQNLFIGVKKGGIPPIDFDNESNMVAEFHRGRYYLSFTSTESPDGENDFTAVFNTATNEWKFWSKGFTSFLFNDVGDELIGGTKGGSPGGTPGGSLLQLEERDTTSDFAAGDDITVKISTADRDNGDSMTRKLYQYFRVNAEINSSDTLTATFFTDDTPRRTVTVIGIQVRTLFRLPAGSRGFTWRVEVDFEGTSQMKFHGAEAQWKPLISS